MVLDITDYCFGCCKIRWCQNHLILLHVNVTDSGGYFALNHLNLYTCTTCICTFYSFWWPEPPALALLSYKTTCFSNTWLCMLTIPWTAMMGLKIRLMTMTPDCHWSYASISIWIPGIQRAVPLVLLWDIVQRYKKNFATNMALAGLMSIFAARHSWSDRWTSSMMSSRVISITQFRWLTWSKEIKNCTCWKLDKMV